MLGLGTRLQTQERLPAPSSPRNPLLLRNQNRRLCPCWSSWEGGDSKGGETEHSNIAGSLLLASEEQGFLGTDYTHVYPVPSTHQASF